MLNFFKGVIIGASSVIPGVCSALVAMLLNSYNQLLEVISKFYSFKILKKNISLVIGIILGIISSVITISFIFQKSEDILICIFLGLSLGGFVKLNKKTKINNFVDILMIIVGILLSILPELLIDNSTLNDNYTLIIIGGLLASLAFILPGISGSLILLTLGIYETVIISFTECFKIFINPLDSKCTYICVCFLFSFVLGSILFSKIIRKFLNYYEQIFLKFCLGLLIGSAILISYKTYNLEINIIIKFLSISLGLLIMKFLN